MVKFITYGVSKAYKIALRKPLKRRPRWQTSCKKKLKALKGELKKFKKGRIKVKWVPTADMIEDGLTKALPC